MDAPQQRSNRVLTWGGGLPHVPARMVCSVHLLPLTMDEDWKLYCFARPQGRALCHDI